MSDIKEKIEKLRTTIFSGVDDEVEYMSKKSNWLCVHATKYELKCNDDGNLYIETTAMATDNDLPRASANRFSRMDW